MSDTATRILDAAGRVFLERGVYAADVGDIATEAGTSRATVYRWFGNRHGLRLAYIHREARRVGERVVTENAHVADPVERLVDSVVAALRVIRGEPVLAAWFTPEGSGATSVLAGGSDVVAGLAGALEPGGEPGPQARWLVRIVLSLLTHPGGDEEEERELLRRFVAPVVLGRPDRPGQADQP